MKSCLTCNWFSAYEHLGKEIKLGECQNSKAIHKTCVFNDDVCEFWEEE